MKKYGIFLALLFVGMTAMAQKAGIYFEVKSHDFGKIKEEAGKVTYVFNFKNNGNAPLVVNRVQASCGCTTPSWTKEPIEAGKGGSITVTYNPEGRPGMFTKTITVYSNAADEQTILIIRGEVIPRQSSESNDFPVYLGGISAKAKVIQMNNIEKGKTQVRTLEIKNTEKMPIEPKIEGLPSYLTATVSPNVLKPGQEGKITVTFNSALCSVWGPITDFVYVNNGKSMKSEVTKLIVVSNVVEDFSHMTLEQKRKAPIVELNNKVLNFGTLAAGAKKTENFALKNAGINPLEIRRIINTNKEITIRQTKLSVNGGKTGYISAELNTKGLAAGDYKKSITVQTNDPDSSFMILVLSWSVRK